MQPLTSAITGVLAQAQKALSVTGQPHGDDGRGGSLTTSETDRRAWLVAHTPAETDKALQTSLQSSLGVELALMHSYRYPPGGGYVRVPDGCGISGKFENLPAALEKVRGAMVPAERGQVEEWLTLLQVATAGAKRSEAGTELALDLYTGALARYPADVAKTACMNLAMSSRWFPTLADLIEEADRLAAPRKQMFEALLAAA